MFLCLDGLKTGQICFGDLMARLHGSEVELTTAGFALSAALAIAVFHYVFGTEG
jgi:hypothetical protein